MVVWAMGVFGAIPSPPSNEIVIGPLHLRAYGLAIAAAVLALAAASFADMDIFQQNSVTNVPAFVQFAGLAANSTGSTARNADTNGVSIPATAAITIICARFKCT